jgi:hypothetical protein
MYSSEILNRNSELTHEIYKSAKWDQAKGREETANHWAFEQSHSKVRKKKGVKKKRSIIYRQHETQFAN